MKPARSGFDFLFYNSGLKFSVTGLNLSAT
jgi:hypothetical protein